MAKPNVLILRAPGTNCDQETAFAFEKAGAATELLHVNRLLENPALFERFQMLCIPGGFSYGDDVAAGRILANQIEHHLAEEMTRFKDDGKLILGICNGFQVLLKSGVLLQPAVDQSAQRRAAATLTWNDSARFDDRWVELAVDGHKCVFLKDIERMYLPVAHAEGKFVARDADELARLETDGQLVLRYRPLDGSGAKGLADAEVVRATGMSEAMAMAKKAEAWQQYNEAAILQIVVEKLPELAAAVAGPLSKTEKIVVIGGGTDGSAGASKVTQDVVNVVAQLPPMIQALTGMILEDVLKRIPEYAKSAASAAAVSKPAPAPEAPAQAPPTTGED